MGKTISIELLEQLSQHGSKCDTLRMRSGTPARERVIVRGKDVR